MLHLRRDTDRVFSPGQLIADMLSLAFLTISSSISSKERSLADLGYEMEWFDPNCSRRPSGAECKCLSRCIDWIVGSDG
jgi:hypothetical protein